MTSFTATRAMLAVDHFKSQEVRMKAYTVKVKTSDEVEVKRSWTYEDIRADSSIGAGMVAAKRASEWWGESVLDLEIVSITEEPATA